MAVEFHLDPLGQEIREGSCVVWVGGKTKYAGVRVYRVVSLTPKMLRIMTSEPRLGDTISKYTTAIEPYATLVVKRTRI